MPNKIADWLAISSIWGLGAILLLVARYLYGYDLDMFIQPVIIFGIAFTLVICIANGIEGITWYFVHHNRSRRQ